MVLVVLVIVGLFLLVWFLRPRPSVSHVPRTVVFDATAGWIDDAGRGEVADMQRKVDEVYARQENNEFGTQRFALLFKPGTYHVRIQVGYYTTVLGLGASPADVVIVGNVQSLSQSAGEDSPGYLNRFWRGCENLTVVPDTFKTQGPQMLWGVSQASHLRAVHVQGSLLLARWPGFASGGFMSDCKVQGSVMMETQQQFFVRNSVYADLTRGAWNFVLMGNTGQDPETTCEAGKALVTVVDTVPVIAAKPFLSADPQLCIRQPATARNQRGNIVAPVSVLTSLYVASSSKDTATSLNQALATRGLNVLLTPGVYELTEALRVQHSGTVVLGIGLATLQPTQGTPALVVADDAVGVRLAGFMVQAGSRTSSCLLQVGERKGGREDAPTVLSDVYCRVGGPDDTQAATTMLLINQDYTVLDGVWLWRADHNAEGVWQGLGPDKARCDHCLVVNGDHVITYGLHCEHALKELVLWNGERGSMYFFQSELAYDVPPDWDYPAIRVAESVTSFWGVGIGVYSFFARKFGATPEKPAVSSAIRTGPSAGICIMSACSLLLNAKDGAGRIEHVINDSGPASTVENPSRPMWCGLHTENLCPRFRRSSFCPSC